LQCPICEAGENGVLLAADTLGIKRHRRISGKQGIRMWISGYQEIRLQDIWISEYQADVKTEGERRDGREGGF